MSSGPGPRLRTRSSRCGPTRETPRSSSSPCRSARAASRRLGQGSAVGRIVRQRERRLVLGLGGVAGRAARHRGVGVAEVGPQVGDQGETLGEDLGADPGEVGVPDAQRGQGCLLVAPSISTAARVAGGLQQGVALAQDALVVGPGAGEARGAQHEQVVEEPPPLGRVSLDQGEVLRGEDHGADEPDQVAGLRQRRLVDPGAVGLAGVDLHLEHGGASVAHHRRPDDGLVGTGRGRVARRWPPGGRSGGRGSRSPRRGWSCPGRCCR